MRVVEQRDRIVGVRGAQRVLVEGEYCLARWSHEHAMGWYLYRIYHPACNSQDQLHFLFKAGSISLAWSDEEVTTWFHNRTRQ